MGENPGRSYEGPTWDGARTVCPEDARYTCSSVQPSVVEVVEQSGPWIEGRGRTCAECRPP